MKFRIIVALLLISALCINVSALNGFPIDVLEACPIPEDFDFRVNESCTDHDYFNHATARADGSFAILSNVSNVQSTSNDAFFRAYIDVYDPAGNFLYELSFHTEFGFEIELTDETINMYFFDTMICYDLDTSQLTAYKIPAGAASDSGLSAELRKASFEAGGYQYRCIRNIMGNVKLIREKDGNKETLVDMNGSNFYLQNTVLPVAILSIGVFAFLVLWSKRKKTKEQPKGDIGKQ